MRAVALSALFALAGGSSAAFLGDTPAAASTSPCPTTVFFLFANGPSVYVGTNQQAGETDICLGANPGFNPLGGIGGVLAVPGAVSAPVTVDSAAFNCAADPGYRRLLAGTALTNPFFVDIATPSNGGEVCVEFGGELLRVEVSATGGVGGLPTFTQTDALLPSNFSTWPTAGPSSTCRSSSIFAPLEVLVTPAASMWLSTVSSTMTGEGSSTGSGSVCIRIRGPVVVGGMLKYPDALYRMNQSPSDCPVNVFNLTDPVPAGVAISPLGSTPLRICLLGDLALSPNETVVDPRGIAGTGWVKDSDSVI